MDSYGFVWFTPLYPGGLWVHPGSFGSLVSAQGGVGFMRVVGFILGRSVHLGAPWGSLCSSGVVGFTPVRPGCRCVHPWSLGSLGCALLVVGFIRGGTQVCPGGSWVHPGSLGSLGCALGVVAFIRGRWIPSPWGSLGSYGVVWFTLVRPWCLWVHPGSFGLVGSALVWVGFMWVVGFIRGRCVHSGVPWESLGSSGMVGAPWGSLEFGWCTRMRHGRRWVHEGAPLVLMGSYCVVGFTRVRAAGICVYPGC